MGLPTADLPVLSSGSVTGHRPATGRLVAFVDRAVQSVGVGSGKVTPVSCSDSDQSRRPVTGSWAAAMACTSMAMPRIPWKPEGPVELAAPNRGRGRCEELREGPAVRPLRPVQESTRLCRQLEPDLPEPSSGTPPILSRPDADRRVDTSSLASTQEFAKPEADDPHVVQRGTDVRRQNRGAWACVVWGARPVAGSPCPRSLGADDD